MVTAGRSMFQSSHLTFQNVQAWLALRAEFIHNLSNLSDTSPLPLGFGNNQSQASNDGRCRSACRCSSVPTMEPYSDTNVAEPAKLVAADG